ncbi:MAG TPA: glucose-6-phosphate dehydrogenase [Actinobacteria bacterium]|nr:glucose-6-phosphate dehydrogenase [Actinomycetes bacterium]HEX21489.1 glucose-6-phosphate dehydrogenase [Actinomycetota bacterium]
MKRQNKKIYIPTIYVVFGVTGDLFRRKVAPALYHLYVRKQWPQLFSVVGYARRNISDTAFKKSIEESVNEHLGIDKHLPDDFLSAFSYQQGNFEYIDDYKVLARRLGKIDEMWKICSNKLFHLAVPPKYNEKIFYNLSDSGLTIPCGSDEGWTRVLVEKPFGKNLKEARDLDHLLGKLFKEEQIYRIDHYLAKELLQNILAFRFANNLLEDIWNNEYVEKIEVKLLENIDIEGRGNFYDGVGALLDIGQNHLLQMLALATMENPVRFLPESIREQRKLLLQELKKLTLKEVKTDTIRGQYKGYLKEKGVRPGSTTETYFKIKAYIDSPRWEGVPIYIEGGKKIPKAQKEVKITFAHPAFHLLLEDRDNYFKNTVCFRLQPKPGIAIQFWSKKPGAKMKLEKKLLSFKYKDVKQEEESHLDEYAKLLLDCINGDQSLFLSSSEALSGWKFIDSIITGWEREMVPLVKYDQDESFYEFSQTIEKHETKSVTMNKEIGIVGLGKMGANIARQLIDEDWRVVGFNRTASVTKKMESEGLNGVYNLAELVSSLTAPRVIWIMLPAGKPVDDIIFGAGGLADLLSKKDIIIDAGNSFYKDSIRRHQELRKYGINFVDIGVSGGPEGARHGACLMVGGDRRHYNYLKPLFRDTTVPRGYQFFKGSGAGHFVKMVHNGIEYGMMQAIAEGFNVMKRSDFNLNLIEVADVYNHGSVIEASLMGWLKNALKLYGQDLKKVSGIVKHTGEGEWTVKTAKELKTDAKNIEQAFKFRVDSVNLNGSNYTGKLLTAIRDQFGGHGIK